jgi:phage gp36-like protein
MSYCTPEQVIQRYGTKVNNWANSEASIEIACADASAEIDGYLALAGVSVPLSLVPAYIPGYAIDMAAYLLLVRSGFMEGASGEEELSTRAAAARRFFEEWAKGHFDSGDKDGVPPGSGTAGKRIRYSSGRKMDLRGYS